MHFPWMFIFLLVTCWITPTEETKGSWGISSLLSSLIHGDREIESETVMERSLSRRKRATGVTEYTVDIEISFPDPSFANQIKQFIANNLTFPIPIGINDTEITSINVAQACNQTGSSVQCSCESGYTWPSTVCVPYNTCPGSNASRCDCITGSSIPTEYCRPETVSIKLLLRILGDYPAELGDQTSATYLNYKTDLEAEFVKAYKPLTGFISANVTGFRSGSIVVDYTVVTEPVSPSALTTANQNLVDNLKAANYSVDSIKPVINDQSFITVSPSNIFNKDRVELNCTVNISSYTSVAWYFNGTLQNTSNSKTTGSGPVQSIFTISRASVNNRGTYLCTVDNDLTSYQMEKTIVVLPLTMTILESNVSCNKVDFPIIKCCTEGLSMDFDLTCNTKPEIKGVVRNDTPCKTYIVSADEKTCATFSSGSYDCTCSTINGANETRNVKVFYQASLTVNSNLNAISEGGDLIVKCNCNATSVNSISWFFQNNKIPSQYSTSNPTSCNSTLTVPSTELTVAWSGTYLCSVDTGTNGIVSGSKQITVHKLVKPEQINRSPVSSNFQCKGNISFSCCLSDTTGYKKAELQIVTKPGTILSSQDMPSTNQCFRTTYTPSKDTECVNFTAQCVITNEIGDTVTSLPMGLTLVKNAVCTTPYIGETDSVIEVSCRDEDPKLTGTKTLICDESGDWKINSLDCVSAALDDIKNQLDILTSPGSEEKIPAVLANLSSTVTNQRDNISTSTNNIQLVVSLLQRVNEGVKKVEPTVMKDFLQTVDIIVGNTATWNQFSDSNRITESSNILLSVEQFAGKLSIDGSINLTNNSNIQLFGNIISNLSKNYFADFNSGLTDNLTGNVQINRTTLDSLPQNATIISVAYATLKDILKINGSNSSTQGEINGLVMTTTVTANFTSFKIGMDFKKSNETLNNATCVFWNFAIHDWDSSGCHPENNSSTMVTCVCDHLTSFSILMSYIAPEEEKILTYISYFGLGISILSLVICIILEATVWKSVTKNKTSYMRHICIMNISVTLLMADIWFIIGGVMFESKNVDVCVAATFFTHVFYLCTFFWMLTMGLILFYRLMCVFHDLSKKVMMGISFFLGYGCPIIISVITVAVTQPSKKYTSDKACWLNVKDSNAFLAFIIPALTILLVNFITLFVVIIKVLRPSVGDRPKKEEKSSLNHITKCILILTPLLGLTWGFGIGTLFTNTVAIHGIFSALNALQGLFILLFGCLMDKKVRDALFSRFSVSRWSSQQTKTSNLSTSDPVFSKGFINLFARKGVYNISSAQASSSSEMSNSYSLLT
ncbi:adhesion G protein-coupled receptor F5 isoform X2 [Bufo gargarizans]|uniref:adhesion G protein-coupled receptor F5 isoform X2 n=1 Tax=Bufo gargarizans TaxID=30331 RepID=UPI001CF3ABFB|nr:adhesion G protein-coupled receptor F5 isoform X2 [Bufo gargarizans]